MTFDRTTPPFHFAITEEVKSRCPFPFVEKGVTKEISADNFAPTQGQEKDTGYDVRCAEPKGVTLIPGGYFKMRLGFRMHAPDGWWLTLAPRSSTFATTFIHPLYGVIDELYEAEMCFVGQYLPDTRIVLPANIDPIIPFGERIAQVIPAPRYDMTRSIISNEDMNKINAVRKGSRGLGGFGSSGAA